MNMQRYTTYRDSDAEWVGKIPDDWKTKRLKYLVFNRVTPADADEGSYLGLDSVQSWTMKICKDEEAPCDGAGILYDGECVLFGKLRPYLAKVALPENSGPCSSEFLTLIPRAVTRKYLAYLLSSESFIDEVNSLTYGVRMPRAGWDLIGNMRIPVPTASEQQAIVNYLDSRTAEIDTLVVDCEREVGLLQEYRRAVISEAVTKGLDPDAPMKDSGVEWIGEIPDDWDAARLDKVAIRKSGHTPDKKIPEYWDGNIVWISLADSPRLRKNVYVSESTTMTTEAGIANSSAELLPEGSVLLSRDASVGLTAIAGVQLAVSQHFMAYICDANLSNEYLRYVFLAMHQEFEKLSMGSTIPTIGLPLMRKLAIPYPSRKTQDDIVGYLNAKVTEIDVLIADNQSMADKLREYRKSLISEAVTGKFKVPGVR